MLFGGLQDAIDAAKHSQGQNNILIFTALEGIANEVCNAPNEVNLFAVVVHVV
jgi:hypothetical protein